VLGVLRLSTGVAVPLDRGALFGRKPEIQKGPPGERPHVIQLASPGQDISRNHLELKLDGWHVVLKDLHSTNGTEIAIPGRPPQRLRGGEEVLIPPGTVVTLADEVSFVYEVNS
jgi:pSer/pThr/pTyr-binding forkhead associated (FHA) protein